MTNDFVKVVRIGTKKTYSDIHHRFSPPSIMAVVNCLLLALKDRASLATAQDRVGRLKAS